MDKKNLEELLHEASALQDGYTKLFLLEEAARIADSQNNIVLGFNIRTSIIKIGCFYGYFLNSILAFSWCLTQYDNYPEKFKNWKVLWLFKWIVAQINSFPELTMEKIDELFYDMKQRYTKQGASLRPYYNLKCEFSIKLGDQEKAFENYTKWINSPRDSFSDCLACEVDKQISYMIFSKNYEKAFELSKPILLLELKCAEIPHLTYSKLLLPLLECGKVMEAKNMYDNGYRLISSNKEFISPLSKCLTYLTIIDINRALTIFEKHFNWAFDTANVYRKFEFYLASWIMFSRLKKSGYNNLMVNLPNECNIFNLYNLKGTSDISNWFEISTKDIANRFNNRNGNNYFNDLIEDTFQIVDSLCNNPSL